MSQLETKEKSDCSNLLYHLLSDLISGNQQAACCGGNRSEVDTNYQHALVRFNETASQTAADKLQQAAERREERYHETLRQMRHPASVATK